MVTAAGQFAGTPLFLLLLLLLLLLPLALGGAAADIVAASDPRPPLAFQFSSYTLPSDPLVRSDAVPRWMRQRR